MTLFRFAWDLMVRYQSRETGRPMRGTSSHGEERGQFGLVRLKLLPRRPNGGVLVGGVLQFDDAQRQPVDEHRDVRPAGVPVLGDGELVDSQPVVVGRGLELDDSDLISAHPSIGIPILDRHALDEHPVEGSVAGLQCRPFRAGELAEGIVQRGCWKARIQLGEGVAEPTLQDYLAVVVPLGTGRVRRDVRAVRHTQPRARSQSRATCSTSASLRVVIAVPTPASGVRP